MSNQERTGCLLAQRITLLLLQTGLPYKQIEDIVYTGLEEINRELQVGDWLTFPTGAAYTKTFDMEAER